MICFSAIQPADGQFDYGDMTASFTSSDMTTPMESRFCPQMFLFNIQTNSRKLPTTPHQLSFKSQRGRKFFSNKALLTLGR
jgi:hypothetical protein